MAEAEGTVAWQLGGEQQGDGEALVSGGARRETEVLLPSLEGALDGAQPDRAFSVFALTYERKTMFFGGRSDGCWLLNHTAAWRPTQIWAGAPAPSSSHEIIPTKFSFMHLFCKW